MGLERFIRPSCRGVAILLVTLRAVPAAAQELEPRAYSASPVGATFLVAGVARSTGSVVFDPTLPFRDVNAKIGVVVAGGGTTFGLFGKLALVTGVVPISWGRVTGRVGDDPSVQAVTRMGLADARFKLSVNLIGNPAMDAAQFARAPRRAILGTSLTVAAPIGQYDGTRLINLGTNRWAFKPEAGVSIPRGRWFIDGSAGVWLFAKNDDFYPGGLMRTQAAVAAFQAHLSYTLRPRLWLAGDATWYSGGAVRVGDAAPTGSVNNSRIGVTVSLPVGRTQSVKFAFSKGVSVRTGTDFTVIAATWQRTWVAR